jgi:transcriptional regulator with XRE-family HTH domain
MTQRKTSNQPTLSDQIRTAIKDSGLTRYAIGKRSGVDASVIQRFMLETRSPRLDTIDKIAAALNLRLCKDPHVE